MTQKQPAMALVKPWPQTASFRSNLRQIVANLRNLVQIPTGYEDESGFHYGVEPALSESQLPPN